MDTPSSLEEYWGVSGYFGTTNMISTESGEPRPIAEAGVPASLRPQLIEDLYARLDRAQTAGRGLRFWWKCNAWRIVVGGTRRLKRLIDITGALFALILLSPLFLAVAVLIKLTDSGPILHKQTRVGQWGREFPFPKFRSMVVNAEKLKDRLLEQNQHSAGVTFKMKRDPRVTWIGRIIRKLSIDELPQLWCVVKGDMSLVGPRPPLQYEVEQYKPWHYRRVLEAKPGITGLWQVSGRSRTTFDDMVRLDLRYAKNPSAWADIKILLATPRAVISGKGAC